MRAGIHRTDCCVLTRTRRNFWGATLAEVIIGLALFAMLSLAVTGTLIQTARLDTKDVTLTESTILADTLMERRVSDAREYERYRDLLGTPDGDYWTLESDRPDNLQTRYIYRVEVSELNPAMKRVMVSVSHRDSAFPIPTPDLSQGQNGVAITVGTMIAEPAR